MAYYIFEDKTYEENAQIITKYMEKRRKNTLRAYVSEEIKNMKYEICHDILTRNNIYNFLSSIPSEKSFESGKLFDHNHKYLTIYSAYLLLSSPTHKSFAFRQFEFYNMCTNMLNLNLNYVYLKDSDIIEFVNHNPYPLEDDDLELAFSNGKMICPGIVEKLRKNNLEDILYSMRYKTFVQELNLNSRLITQLARLYIQNH